MDAPAILFTAVGRASLGAVDVPQPRPGELLVEAELTSVSPGTELRCLAGQQPGTVRWPFIPGYALVGRVVAGADGVRDGPPEGARVLCSGTLRASEACMWGGHVGLAVQSPSDPLVIPDGVSARVAGLGRLAAIAYHGLRLAAPQPHERVAILGLGPVGQIAARLYRAAGARVAAADRRADRVALARAAGIEACDDPDALAELLGGGADVVVDATGAPAAVAGAVALAAELRWDESAGPDAKGARLVLQGSYPDTVPLPYQAAFAKQLTVLIPRSHQRRDLLAVFDLLGRGLLQLDDLAGERYAPTEAQAVYDALRAGELTTASFGWGAAS